MQGKQAGRWLSAGELLESGTVTSARLRPSSVRLSVRWGVASLGVVESRRWTLGRHRRISKTFTSNTIALAQAQTAKDLKISLLRSSSPAQGSLNIPS